MVQAGHSAHELQQVAPVVQQARASPSPTLSPAELRQKVQTQQLESGVEYSWLPTSPKRIRVKKPRQHDDQLNFDFEPGGSLPEQ